MIVVENWAHQSQLPAHHCNSRNALQGIKVLIKVTRCGRPQGARSRAARGPLASAAMHTGYPAGLQNLASSDRPHYVCQCEALPQLCLPSLPRPSCPIQALVRQFSPVLLGPPHALPAAVSPHVSACVAAHGCSPAPCRSSPTTSPIADGMPLFR